MLNNLLLFSADVEDGVGGEVDWSLTLASIIIIIIIITAAAAAAE